MPKGYKFWLPKFWLPNLVLYQTDNLIYQSWGWSGYISIQISDLFLHTFSRKRPENFMDGRKDSWPDKRLKGLVGWMKRWYFVLQTDGWTTRKHYSDIMSAMASQITSITIFNSTVYLFMHRSKKTSKLRVTGLCEGNSPLSSEFPAQSASTAENFLFDDVIMPW